MSLMNESRPYRRPAPKDWWAKAPYRAYTVREMSGLAVAGYGAVVFAGVYSLSQGPESWAAYVRFLQSPVSLLLHAALLAAVLYHVKTWFQILPKTMPKLILGREPVAQRTITRVATIFAGACSLALVLITLGVAR